MTFYMIGLQNCQYSAGHAVSEIYIAVLQQLYENTIVRVY